MPEWLENPNPEVYLSDNYVVLDFETYGGEFGDAGNPESGIVLAAWLDGKVYGSRRDESASGGEVPPSIEARVGSEFEQEALVDRCRRADFIVAHNAKYELRWLHRMGVELRKILPYCTQIGEYVIAGNRPRRLSLDATARRYGLQGKHEFAGACIKAGVDVRSIPERALLNYCKNDVYLTHEIFLRQRQILADSGLLRVALGRNSVTPALASIEFEGMQLDADRVHAEYGERLPEYATAAERFNQLTGGVNFKSPKQLGEYLYDTLGFEEPRRRNGSPVRSPAGGRKTDKKTLSKLTAFTLEQKAFLKALKELIPLKRKVQILEQLEHCCRDDGGRVYASFNQTVTQTHRLSSTGGKYKLQFHNFPREYKRLFTARDAGWSVCEGDAPQLEFRVAVDLGGDEQGKRDVRDGVDVHQFTADIMGIARQNAKEHTFKPLYGGQSGTPRERAYYNAFRDRYPGIYETQRGWTYSVLEHKQLRTASGLIFYWPDTTIDRSGCVTNTPNIFNYPIQMFATADIIPLTLVLVWHQIAHLRVRIVNTIHDSIIAEVHPDDLAEYKQILVDSFTNKIYDILSKLYKYDFTTPLGVGIKVGSHWGEGEEEKHERHS